MAKNKKKAKAFLPKKIGGVKVPRSVRRGRFGELLASRTGQALIAEAVLGAGAVAAGFKAKDNAKVRDFAHDAKEKVGLAAGDAGRGKLPKSIRKRRFGELLASRKGQALIAEALLGATAVATALKAKDDPKVRGLAQDARDKADDAGRELGSAGSSLAYALGEAARSFTEALRRQQGSPEPRSFEAQQDAETAWAPYGGQPAAEAQEDAGKKPSPAYEAGPL